MKENLSGYTLIYQGTTLELVNKLKDTKFTNTWKSIFSTEYYKVIGVNTELTKIYVANEFIDWAVFRRTNEYICCYGQTPINSINKN